MRTPGPWTNLVIWSFNSEVRVGKELSSTFMRPMVSNAQRENLAGSVDIVTDLMEAEGYRWREGLYLTVKEYMDIVRLGASTGSNLTWNTILNWWNTAVERERMQQTSKSLNYDLRARYPLPRSKFLSCLLDLQDISLGPDLRLSLAETDARQGHYVSLSYRWKPDKERPYGTYHWQ